MRVLALDTTTADGSLAIIDDARVLFARRGQAVRSHAERLPNDIIEALGQSQMTIADIDLFAVVTGPGSFTGLRVGIAAIQGLALVQRKRIVALSALEVIATAAAAHRSPGTIVGVWMDAHRKEVFSTLCRVTGRDAYEPGRLDIIEAATVDRPAATLVRWRAGGATPEVIIGDGAMLYAEVIDSTAQIEPHPLLAETAALMAAPRNAAGLTVDPTGVQPVYVRRPDAEVARDARRAAEANHASASPHTAS